ncbi:hypothetical protein Acsp06_65200 [Actinomycetospora sp. NBRC 106375]|uniref:hypothetical protein n=1 Tax=Actinomycetospora sp. NBRC 106375 TaxID=3032207 RepID=UPI0024A05DE8|nr:hypothetical protein [Actinomycetospora sp. NBRC 106375]GLZ50335.1 hypothetical protein Acsp06_65200 [Actinomycetospora sp. NBRC 106375]
MEVGERWGYRSRAGEKLVEAEVVRLGAKRPARVRVRFVDLDHEGREEWVPPARLKVPWGQVEEFMARDRRWEAARALSPRVLDRPTDGAASQVIDDTYVNETVRMAHRNADRGLLYVGDLDRLLRDLDWTHEQFVEQPGVFYVEPDGIWVAPWPVTEAVAQALAARHADALLGQVADDERRARLEAVYGHEYGRGKNSWSVSPEICAEVDAELGAPRRELLRRWCGADAVDRRDELEALRSEVRRLGELVVAAIEALRTAGADKAAARVEKQLGVHLPS